jgi:hypothetical protein
MGATTIIRSFKGRDAKESFYDLGECAGDEIKKITDRHRIANGLVNWEGGWGKNFDWLYTIKIFKFKWTRPWATGGGGGFFSRHCMRRYSADCE